MGSNAFPEDDPQLVADAILQAAQDTIAQGTWEPTRWTLPPLPDEPQTNLYGQPHDGQLPREDGPPTLGDRVQQPVRSPIPGIAVDNSGRQYTVQNVPPPNTIEAIGSAAVLNVPLAITGFATTTYDAAHKFGELVDMLASGKYRTDDPEIVSRAVDVAGIVTSGSFANRVAQEASRTRGTERAARVTETGEPYTPSRDVTLDIQPTRDGRFNIRADVDGQHVVDMYVRNVKTDLKDPGVLQFGHANIDEPWQRQGISSAVQQHLEATTGKPFIPDSFLTESAYQRWLKLDPEAVRGHIRHEQGGEAYWQRSVAYDIIDYQATRTPWTETARMARVREQARNGELTSPLGPNGEFTLRGQPMVQPEGLRGEFTLGTGGARDVPTVNFEIKRTAKITDAPDFQRYKVEMTADGQSIGWAYIHPIPGIDAFKFSSVAVNTDWQRRGIGTALQQTLEARLGRPMMPDTLLTREAYNRWLKIDRDAVHGKYDPPGPTDEGYWTRNAPYEETARTRQVRETAAAGTLRPPRIRGEYSLGMGGARDTPGIGHNQPPRQLDPAGYYSHAQDVTQGLQVRGTPEQMWRGIERGGVRETEIRQLGLDELLLSRPIAEARRTVVDHTAELGRMRQEAKDLDTGEGQWRWIERNHPDIDRTDAGSVAGAALEARITQKRLNEVAIPEAERRLQAAQQNYDHQYTNRPQQPVDRDTIARHIEENRLTVNREVYIPPKILSAGEIRGAITALEGPNKDWSPFRQALMNRTEGRMLPENAIREIISELSDHSGNRLGVIARSTEDYYRLPRGSINEVIKDLTGRSVADFSPPRQGSHIFPYANVTLDPRNSTLRGVTLHLDSPASPVVERLWESIPQRDAVQLRAAWGRSDMELQQQLTPSQYANISQLRRQYPLLMTRISKETQRGHYVDPHYRDLDIFGHYMTSLQRLTPGGETTFTLHQAQSNWGAESRIRDSTLSWTGHPIVQNLSSWLDPTLRSFIRDAVESGATSITLPSAETVFRYNPPGDNSAGLTRLYNQAILRRTQVVLRELDNKYSSRGDKVDRLHTYEGDPTQVYQDPGMHSGTIRRIDRRVDDVRHGFQGNWTTYPITPAIRRNFEQGRGMRLFSSGIPVSGEEDGQTVQP